MADSSISSTDSLHSTITKRLRSLRKKLNRINQMEESLLTGKTLNKEQEEVLRSKPQLVAVIDELDRLLAATSAPPPPPSPSPPADVDPSSTIEDLLTLLYFGSLFDVKTQAEYVSSNLTRAIERSCCLTYDVVTDDAAAADILSDADLDAVSRLGAVMTSRGGAVSHRDAFRTCVAHAIAWLRKSDEPVYPGASMTYAGVRAKLDKIVASGYYTAVPEVRDVDMAEVVSKELSVAVEEREMVTVEAGMEGSSANEDEQEDSRKAHLDESSNADEAPKTDEEAVVDPSEDVLPPQKEQEKLDADAPEHDPKDTNLNEPQFIERRPYQNQHGGGRRGGHQNGRGGRGGKGGGIGYQNGRGGGGYQNGRGGNGGYQNGRGGNGGYQNGRGGGGGYQNGRGGQYYSDYGYNPRNNYYNNRGGRGNRSGGGGGSMYNNHGGAHGGHVQPGQVEVGGNA